MGHVEVTDEDIEALIDAELEDIGDDISSSNSFEDTVVNTTEAGAKSNEIHSFPEIAVLSAYRDNLSSRSEQLADQIRSCVDLLQITDKNIANCQSLHLASIADVAEESEEATRLRILKEIEEEGEESVIVSDINVDDEDDSDLKKYEEEILMEIERDRMVKPLMLSDDETTLENSVNASPSEQECSVAQVCEETQLILYDKNRIRLLEKQAQHQLLDLNERHQETQVKQKEQLQHLTAQINLAQQSAANERRERRDAFQKEEQEISSCIRKREEETQRLIFEDSKRIQQMDQQLEEQLTVLERQAQAERSKLQTQIHQIEERRKNAKNRAATIIQSCYKGYRVRKLYKGELARRVSDALTHMEASRIEKANQRIEQLQLQKQKKEEEKLRLEEEKKAKVEAERQRILEEKRKKEEAKRLEKKRKEEERRLEEERKCLEKERLEEEARINREKAEEAKRIKEEKKRQEKERKELEKKQREAEKKRLEEEKRQQAEEVKRKRQEEIEEQQRLKAEQEKNRKLEEEQRLKEEQQAKQKVEEQLKHREDKAVNKISKLEPSHKSDCYGFTGGETSTLMETTHTNTGAFMKGQVAHLSNGDPTRNVCNIDPVTVSKDISNLKTDSMEPSHVDKKEELDVKKMDADTSESIVSEPTAGVAEHLPHEPSESQRKIKEYKQWMEEQKASNNAKKSAKTPRNAAVESAVLDMSLVKAKIEERRQRWIQECTPWSQISAKANSKILKPRKTLNRPSSASSKPQEPVPEAAILHSSGCSTLSQMECVQLEDLPGSSLSTLSSCRRLKALSISRMSISKVDSLDQSSRLEYVHLSLNYIDSVKLTSSSIVYLNLSHNNLSSIKGFEACVNLRYLNLSNNKISKLGSLGFHRKLHTLILSHNELISSRGLNECATLQTLDISNNHLTSMEELTNLALLRHLLASANNIMEIPRLANCVMLESLILDDNSISSLDGLAYFWLPLLTTVNVSQNSISAIQPLHGCYFVKTIDISHNQLIDVGNISDGLKFCLQLKILHLMGNPVATKRDTKSRLFRDFSHLELLDGTHRETAVETKSTASSELDIVSLCHQCYEAYTDLHTQFNHVLGENLSQIPNTNTQLLSHLPDLSEFYEKSHILAENIRYAHEYGSMSFDHSPTSTLQSSKKLFESKLASAGSTRKNKNKETQEMDEASHNEPDSQKAAKDLFEIRLRTKLESTPLRVSEENIKLLKSTSPRNNSSNQSTSSQKSSSKLRSLQSNHYTQNQQRAATKIQAVWRGYTLRKRLLMALNLARADELADDDSEEELAEVDLTKFDFTDDFMDWQPPAAPQLPQSHAVLPDRHDFESYADDADQFTQPKQAWRYTSDVGLPDTSLLDSARHHVPPLSRMSGEETQRTYHSRKEEQLAEEWGFKDSHTAELMMKRAKKLKYNAQRRKKINSMDAVGRYEFQKKLQQAVEPPKVIAPVRKMAPKKEYFKALEEQARIKQHDKTVQNNTAVERTFEWVHTQVNPGVMQEVANQRAERVSSGESQLPYLDKRVLEGGRTQLVGSPLEIMSVDSYYGPSSASSKGTSQPPGPHRVNGVDATQREKAKKSLRNNNPHYDQSDFSSWGSGKRRTK